MNANADTTVMISAGEASGEEHAAHALHAFRSLEAAAGRTVSAFGMGGAALAAQKCELVVDNRDLSVIGFVDVLINYPRFLARLKRLREALTERRPALLLIVDYPDFNLKLADTARALGVPVLMYVAPQVWAWRAGRIPDIVRRVDHLAVLFPFERDLWSRAGAEVTCVGHPMVRTMPLDLTIAEARTRLSAAVNEGARGTLIHQMNRRIVALLPGSRPGEIRRLLPLMVEVATRLQATRSDLHFVLPRAASIERALLAATISEAASTSTGHAPVIDIIEPDGGANAIAVRAAHVALVASGTATLETGLLGTPMVVVYKVAALNAMLMRRLVRIPDIALVNIVAERRIVAEFVQDKATAAAVADATGRLIDDTPACERMRAELGVIRERLGDGDASGEVARLMFALARRTANG